MSLSFALALQFITQGDEIGGLSLLKKGKNDFIDRAVGITVEVLGSKKSATRAMASGSMIRLPSTPYSASMFCGKGCSAMVSVSPSAEMRPDTGLLIPSSFFLSGSMLPVKSATHVLPVQGSHPSRLPASGECVGPGVLCAPV